MNVAEHYTKLLLHSESVLREMLADPDALAALTTSQNSLLDYDRLKAAIASRPEVTWRQWALDSTGRCNRLIKSFCGRFVV